jgi:hypothetical protein
VHVKPEKKKEEEEEADVWVVTHRGAKTREKFEHDECSC